MNLLCTSGLAKHPYVIPSLNLRIYSGEELSYFIYHNLTLIEENFLNEDLIHFVANELKLPASADRLRRFAGNGDQPSQLMAILREFGYYPEDVLHTFQKQAEQLQKRPAYLRHVDRGDTFLYQGRYRSALRVYQDMWAVEQAIGKTPHAVARIYSHMALANCGMGYYDTALDCMQQSYRTEPNLDTVKLGWQIAQLGGRTTEEAGIQASKEDVAAWQQEFAAKQYRVQQRAQSSELARVQALSGEERREALKEYRAKLCSKYREEMLGE